MKENKGPKDQKLQNAAGLGADKICLNFIRKRAIFGNLSGGPHVAAKTSQRSKEMNVQKAKMKGNENPKGQNERKRRPKRPKRKEMKAQKGQNERKAEKGQNERK